MKKNVLVLAISATLGLVSINANAAVSFADSIITATGNSNILGTAMLGGGAVGSPSLLYAFELERSGINPIWGSAARLLTSGSTVSTYSSSWTFAAASGYRFDSISAIAGGNYATTGSGSVSYLTSLSSPTPGASVNTTGTLTGIGSWQSPTSTITFAPGLNLTTLNANLNVKLSAQRAGGFGSTATIVGLDNAGITGIANFNNPLGTEAYRGPTVFVQVSVVPEPSDFAMLLAGLAVVSVIVKRRAK
jgi:hypothetical protein